MHPLDRIVRLVLPVGAVAVLGTVLTVGWFTQPRRFAKGYAPAQPIPFSHKLHAGTLRMACGYCHSGAARSRTAGLPSAELCLGCHQVTRTDSPAIQRLTALAARGEPLPWARVHRLPDHAFFDHRPHVQAGMLCQTCHGEVQTMTVLERRMPLRMGACLDCHRAARPPAPEHCNACHR